MRAPKLLVEAPGPATLNLATLLALTKQSFCHTVGASSKSASVFVQAFIDQPESLSSNTGQLAAGLAGLLAVPVVAWSEYTLKTTGNHAYQAASVDNRQGVGYEAPE